MSLRSLAIVKDLKLFKVFFEQSKSRSPLFFSVIKSLKSRAYLKSHYRLLLNGFRISKLTQSSCEVIIPKNWLNENDQNQIDDSAFFNAAHFAAEIFWNHINPEPRIWSMSLQSSHIEVLGALSKDLKSIRLKTHLSFQDKENIFFMLRESHKAEMNLFFDGMSADDQLLCQIELKYRVISQPQMYIEG
ncbi:MAG: hypothetical protein ACK5WZ_13145 [Pseudobdellovibrionaceae bacterium]